MHSTRVSHSLSLVHRFPQASCIFLEHAHPPMNHVSTPHPAARPHRAHARFPDVTPSTNRFRLHSRVHTQLSSFALRRYVSKDGRRNYLVIDTVIPLLMPQIQEPCSSVKVYFCRKSLPHSPLDHERTLCLLPRTRFGGGAGTGNRSSVALDIERLLLFGPFAPL
jgi:hypothetical protein